MPSRLKSAHTGPCRSVTFPVGNGLYDRDDGEIRPTTRQSQAASQSVNRGYGNWRLYRACGPVPLVSIYANCRRVLRYSSTRCVS